MKKLNKLVLIFLFVFIVFISGPINFISGFLSGRGENIEVTAVSSEVHNSVEAAGGEGYENKDMVTDGNINTYGRAYGHAYVSWAGINLENSQRSFKQEFTFRVTAPAKYIFGGNGVVATVSIYVNKLLVSLSKHDRGVKFRDTRLYLKRNDGYVISNPGFTAVNIADRGFELGVLDFYPDCEQLGNICKLDFTIPVSLFYHNGEEYVLDAVFGIQEIDLDVDAVFPWVGGIDIYQDLIIYEIEGNFNWAPHIETKQLIYNYGDDIFLKANISFPFLSGDKIYYKIPDIGYGYGEYSHFITENTEIKIPIDLLPGQYNIPIYAKYGNNEVVKNCSIYVKNDIPIIEISPPSLLEYKEPAEITFVVHDNYYLDGAGSYELKYGPGLQNSIQGSYPPNVITRVDISEISSLKGDVQCRLTVFDGYEGPLDTGVNSTDFTITVADTVPPAMSIDLIPVAYYKDPPKLEVEVYDHSIINSVNVTIYWDSGYKKYPLSIENFMPGETNTYIFSLTAEHYFDDWTQQPDGSISMRFNVMDQDENVAYAEIAIIKDTTGPTINPYFGNGAVWGSVPQNIAATVYDPANVSYTLLMYVASLKFHFIKDTEIHDRWVLNESAPDWDAFMNFWSQQTDGQLMFKIVASDSLGNVRVVTREIIKDTIMPQIKAISYNDYSKEPPAITLAFIEENSITLEYNNTNVGTKLELNPIFTFAIDRLLWDQCPDGPTIFNFTAEDAGGNTKTVYITITKDTTPPNISDLEFIGPVNETIPTLAYNSNEPVSSIKFIYNNYSNTYSNMDLSSIWGLIPYGNRTLVLEFSDTLGNKANYSLQFVKHDTMPPELVISFPYDGQHFYSEAPQYSIIATDSFRTWQDLTIYYFINDIGPRLITLEEAFLDQDVWDKALTRYVNITFLIIDPENNSVSESVIVKRMDYIPGEDRSGMLDATLFIDMPPLMIFIMVATCISSAIIYHTIKKRRG
ncbi:MAG: hypothetical protein ACTSRZ_13220 [Promethearchaeota archaeon]